MPLKIAMIGAGSIGFTRRLMGDLLNKAWNEFAMAVPSVYDTDCRTLRDKDAV